MSTQRLFSDVGSFSENVRFTLNTGVDRIFRAVGNV
jgi:hypothetical protein